MAETTKDWDGEIPPPVLNPGIEACIKMAEMFTTVTWPFCEKSRYWCQMDINLPNIIQLQIGDKHLNGFEETPFVTYRFHNDGTYTKYQRS